MKDKKLSKRKYKIRSKKQKYSRKRTQKKNKRSLKRRKSTNRRNTRRNTRRNIHGGRNPFLKRARNKVKKKQKEERIAAEKAEKERIAAEKAEKARSTAAWQELKAEINVAKAEIERIAAEKAKAEIERIAAEKAEQQRIAIENEIDLLTKKMNKEKERLEEEWYTDFLKTENKRSEFEKKLDERIFQLESMVNNSEIQDTRDTSEESDVSRVSEESGPFDVFYNQTPISDIEKRVQQSWNDERAHWERNSNPRDHRETSRTYFMRNKGKENEEVYDPYNQSWVPTEGTWGWGWTRNSASGSRREEPAGRTIN